MQSLSYYDNLKASCHNHVKWDGSASPTNDTPIIIIDTEISPGAIVDVSYVIRYIILSLPLGHYC